jgi:hypothetical protein
MWPPLLGGDLNPILGFCFPLFSMGFPREFPSGWKSVESSGSKSLVFFGQLAYIFYVRFNHFRAVKIPGKRGFDPVHGYLRPATGSRLRLTDGAEVGSLASLSSRRLPEPGPGIGNAGCAIFFDARTRLGGKE